MHKTVEKQFKQITCEDSCSEESLNVVTIFFARTLASEKPNENSEISAMSA